GSGVVEQNAEVALSAGFQFQIQFPTIQFLGVSEGRVTFRWKDYRSKDRLKTRTMTLDAEEFIRRFLIHTLPPGFQRIRYFGLMANRHRKQSLTLCRSLLTGPEDQPLPSPVQCHAVWRMLTASPQRRCPRCGSTILIRIPLPPDTS